MSPAFAQRIGLGCGRLRAGLERQESKRIIETALDLGIRYFDTAPSYGDGCSERVLGEVLNSARSDVLICTKVGLARTSRNGALAAARFVAKSLARPFVTNYHFRFGRSSIHTDESNSHVTFELASVRASVEESLRCLRTAYVDCLMLHEPTLEDPVDEINRLLQQYVRDGVVHCLGVGTGGPIEQLPMYGSVLQCLFRPGKSLHQVDKRLIVHGALREYSATQFDRCWMNTGLYRTMQGSPKMQEIASGRPGFLLAAIASVFDNCKILISTQKHKRLIDTVRAAMIWNEYLNSILDDCVYASLEEFVSAYYAGGK